MGVLRRQYERSLAEQQRGENKPEGPRRGGGSPAPFVFLVIIFVIVLAFPLFRSLGGRSQSLFAFPSADLGSRATELASQQNQLEYSMTSSVSQITEQAQAAETKIQSQQNVLSTQIAQATATEAVNSTATAFSYTQTPLAATQVALNIKIQDEQNAARWREYTAPLWVIGWAVFVFAFLAIGLFLGVKTFFYLLPAYEARLRAVKEQSSERTIYVGPNAITRTDLMHRPVLSYDKQGNATVSGGANDEEMQERVAANAARVKSVQALPSHMRVTNKILPKTEPATNEAGNASPNSDVPELPFPEWRIVESWRGGPKPLGVGANGLITAAAASPHILTAGQTGAGKTHFLMRPLTALALANGEQVAILSLSGNGYGVFDEHPNAYRMQLQDAREIIPILKMVYREVRDRDQLIGGRDLIWEDLPDAPRPRVTLVMDELGNMADQIYYEHKDPKACAEMWALVSMIAREGRKAGITFIAALQEPTAKSVDLRFRRNCTRVGFLLGDRDSSQALLDVTGAESLMPGRFIARVSTLVHGAGFAPSDEEIRAFLAKRTQHNLPPPTWIDATTQQLEEPKEERKLPSGDELDENKAALVRQLHAQGKSNTQIVYAVWGNSGSSFTERMKQVKDILASTTAAAASKPPDLSLEGATTGQ